MSLPNIFSDEAIIPESIFFECTPQSLAALLRELLADPRRGDQQIQAATRFLNTLGIAPVDHVKLPSGTTPHMMRPSVAAAHAVLDVL